MSTLPTRDEILSRIDLVELLGSLTQLPVRVRGSRGQSACPSSTHAQTGATPPVSIDLARGLWCCHGCGAGGTAVDALMVAGGLDRAGAMNAARSLAGLAVDDWPLPSPPPRLTAPTRPPLALTPLDNAATRLAEYAASRRWRVGILESLGVHVARFVRTHALERTPAS